MQLIHFIGSRHQMKDTIRATVTEKLDELFAISNFIHDHPELGGKEFQAREILTTYLRDHGFDVMSGVFGIETAFRATFDAGVEGPVIAFLCEYDALPEVGHGCGHNLIAAMSLGAAIGLESAIGSVGGRILVLGTPAEETNGVKVQMVAKGAFDGVTAALMVHPSPVTEESGGSLAIDALQFQFYGRTAHAAQAPEKGINALDAAVLMYNGISALRQQLPDEVRIHGVISNGGMAPNLIPDYAEVRFYVRAEKKKLLAEVVDKVVACANGAGTMTGTRVVMSRFENGYDNLRTNRTLSTLFNAQLRELGEKEIRSGRSTMGSIDMGNVSQVVPAIHPWLGFGDPDLGLHTKAFADCTVTEKGKALLFRGACALAMTAYEVLRSKEIRAEMKNEFESHEHSEVG